MQKIRISEDCLLFVGLPPGVAPIATARLCEQLPTGCFEVVGAYESIGLYGEVDFLGWEIAVQEAMLDTRNLHQKIHEIPVCFELGMDTREVCQELLMDVNQLSNLICTASLVCFAVGFVPGFPYCTGLPSALQKLSRRPTPRARIPAGSVALAAGQFGIYPAEVPGGWNLIGRTPLSIVDESADYFPISPGDALRVVRIDSEEFEARMGERL